MTASTKPPAGMRDFLPPELARREHALSRIRRAYEQHGFQAIETPALERVETLTGKYGDEGDQLMFKVLKRARKLEAALAAEDMRPSELADLGLRYDLTVPLSRLVAQHESALPRIFKCYQLRPVWRADRPARGRFREFIQCDADIVGTTTPLAEIEVLLAAADALVALGFDDFTVRANDRRLLTALTAAAGIAPELSDRALVCLDKRDKIGLEGVREELVALGIATAAIDRLHELIDTALGANTPAERLRQLGETLGEARPTEAMEGLGQIFDVIAEVGLPGGDIAFDPSLARGLTYYTGPIFEIGLPGFDGSVGGGGRYDGLIGMFLGRTVPACGISLGVERLLMVMEDRDLFADVGSGGCDVFITQFPGVGPSAGLRLAAELRVAGLRVDVSPEEARLGKQFKLAAQLGARVTAVIGPDELEAGEVVLKEMSSGEQAAVAREGAVEAVGALLADVP